MQPEPPMPESSIVVRPEPTFTEASRLRAAGLAKAIAVFERAAEHVALPRSPQPIVLADYGAANGHNSLRPLSSAIAVLRRRTSHDHAILVAHTDAPHNDFTALFGTVADDPESYLHLDGATFTSAIGRSFYNQIVPSKTVNLGWTSWATQWLSRTPCEVPDHVHVSRSTDDAARSAYSDQAALDWHNFVAFRGRELAPAGRVVALTLAADEDETAGFAPLLDAIVGALDEQARDGLLNPDELRHMIIPTFARNEKDFRAPFAPKGRFEGLMIEHLEIFNAEDRFWARFQTDHDAHAFGAQWAAFARSALFPALVRALDGGIHDPRAGQFVEQLQDAVAERLSSAPEPMRIPQALVVLVKGDGSR
ncbi:SAM-dependent methyltransferase [Mycobacterium sp. WUMAC-067]|uniref:class I SAM-dependent methyltransferase n=1 Tax=unclassified Mycobacterium TaxID=2642494 RepID=UPI001CD980DF|nr:MULTISPECIES: class I SAM-dependent methyltransferase [unclassified Mycobacterium]MCA2245573.1 SAM-dependent methyltransferase [Mycobacterium sp. WUMAC-067]MCA2315824.1 SAM-dependent methyltransferase [Mycobacterium sp. WUMAC-025]